MGLRWQWDFPGRRPAGSWPYGQLRKEVQAGEANSGGMSGWKRYETTSWDQLTVGHSEEGEGNGERRKLGVQQHLRSWKQESERVSVSPSLGCWLLSEIPMAWQLQEGQARVISGTFNGHQPTGARSLGSQLCWSQLWSSWILGE